MTAESTVAMTRPCPACGREIAWSGVPVGITGSGTDWRIADHEGCGTASSDNKGETR